MHFPKENDYMKFSKSKIIATILMFFTIAALILIMHTLIEPRNGRKYTIPLIDGMIIQADPPAKKLLKYMEEKYDTEFTRVETDWKWTSNKSRHHDFCSGTWSFLYNGITVSTLQSDEYYYVRDNYGTYLDNYGCYLINEEAEQILYNKISCVVSEVKVSCFPMDYQSKELPAFMTVEEYLDNAGYWLCIVICGDGENAEKDYKEICDILNIKSGQGWMTINYFNEDVYKNIDMENRYSIINNENYTKKLQFDVYTSEPMFVTPNI